MYLFKTVPWGIIAGIILTVHINTLRLITTYEMYTISLPEVIQCFEALNVYLSNFFGYDVKTFLSDVIPGVVVVEPIDPIYNAPSTVILDVDIEVAAESVPSTGKPMFSNKAILFTIAYVVTVVAVYSFTGYPIIGILG